MPTPFSSMLSSVSSFASGLTAIVSGMQKVADQIEPIFLCVAFVLLVFGTMRGFMQNDLRHFFGNLVRLIILVSLIGNWTVVTGIVSNAVNAICSLQISANFGALTNNQTMTTSARMDIGKLTQILEAKASASITAAVQGQSTQPANSQTQSPNGLQQFFNWLNPVSQVQQAGQAVLQNALSTVTHALCAVLYTIFLLVLLLCELIVVLMEVLQNCILVFLGLYVPIGFAEFSIPSLRGQAEAFFKSYIGVQCWPIGWVFVNVVTIALCQNLIAPNQENLGQLLIAILWCVPVLLWVVIGHILAPFYTQKIVVRGGAELQAFAGAMISAVGGTSGAFYGGAFAMGKRATLGLNQGIGAIKHAAANASSGAQRNNNSGNEGNSSNGQPRSGIDDELGAFLPGYRVIEESGGSNRGTADRARKLGVWGLTKAMDAGEFAARTAGNMANTLGALVADAGGYRIGSENFSLPRMQRYSPNRSSRRAATYLNQSTPQQWNPDPSDPDQ
ncbi:MAG: hypothetical protein JOZ31_23655 [Verrucomicrobia bacterium]|nr:hypothetical protein [Verrucomicrobiota bacterium]MBV8483630.1 hypothetical protein [Verrucomicrobiota bacterium]